MKSPVEDADSRAVAPISQKEFLQWIVRAFLAWLLVYMVQGQDGFFARTVDRIDATWVKLLFLNIPLQILLTLVITVCAGSERPAVLKTGIWVGVVNGVLVLGHIVLSVATT